MCQLVDVRVQGPRRHDHTTEHCQRSYEELSGRGVDTQPEQRPYGIDAAFRDLSGGTSG